MKKIELIIALMILGTIISTAQIRNSAKIVKIDSVLYLKEDDGGLFKLNTKVVTVKLIEGEKMPESLKVLRTNQRGYSDLLVPEKVEIRDFINALKKTKKFVSVEYNGYGKLCSSPNDNTYNSLQYDFWHLSKINAIDAWEITSGKPNVKIAILDSEIDVNHIDISNGYDGYSNIDSSLGYNYITNSNIFTSPNEHGTKVAGLIGAKTNNYRGVAGVAGGNHCKGITLIPFVVASASGNVDDSIVDDAIYAAMDAGAKVINMSLEVHSNFSSISAAIEDAHSQGITILCAAGNESSSVIYPASHNKTIAIGEMSKDADVRFPGDFPGTGSNYGENLDLLAPGTALWTTSLSNSYTCTSGTSMTTAIVSGVVGLMLSVNPAMSPYTIRNILRSTAIKPAGYTYDSNGFNEEVGYGYVDAFAAVCASMPQINGSGVVCENSYAIFSLDIPSTLSVNWNINNGSASIFSGQGSSSIYVVANYSGAFELTADIQLNGTTIATRKKYIITGTPTLGNGIRVETWSGNQGFWSSSDGNNRFEIEDYCGAYNRIEGELYRMDNNFNPTTLVRSWYSIGTSGGNIDGSYPGWYLFRLRGVNDCGYSDWLEQEVEMVDLSLAGFMLSYTPSTEILTVTLNEPSTRMSSPNSANIQANSSGTYEIQIWNSSSMIRRYTTNDPSYGISLTGLSNGIYVVCVIKDGKTYSHKFVKR